MRVRVPFFYDATVAMGRSTRLRKEVFVETIEGEVPEVSGNEAPVAMSVCRSEVDVEFRHFGGRFIATPPKFPEDMEMVRGLAPSTGNRFAGPIAQCFGRELPITVTYEIQQWLGDPDYEKNLKADPMKVKEWVSSNRGTRLALAEAVLAGMVIVDGRPWFAVEEPKLAFSGVMTNMLTVTENDVSHATGKRMWGHPITAPVFNATDLHETLEFCHARFGAFRECFPRHSYRVEMPEVFAFDRGRHALEWAASDAVETCASSIRSLSDSAVSAWMAARRHLALADGEDGDWEREMAAYTESLLPYVDTRKAREINECLSVWSDGASISLDFPSARAARP